MTLGQNTLKVDKKKREAAKSEKSAAWRNVVGVRGGKFWSKKGRATRDAIYERALRSSVDQMFQAYHCTGSEIEADYDWARR